MLQMRNPLVSVVMNCYNGEKYLVEAIDSVKEQSYPNWELVFVDNASTDNSADIVRAYADDRIRYVRNIENKPLGAARNTALDIARGEYITFLDTDDSWANEKLEIQVGWMLAHPEVGLVYSNYNKIIGERKTIGLRTETGSPDTFASLLESYVINLQTVMLNRNMLDKHRLRFNEKYEVSEEYDLFLRFALRETIGYISLPLANYRIHDSMMSNRKIGLYAVENAQILDCLEAESSKIGLFCSGSYKSARAKLAYYNARDLMGKNCPREARQALSAVVFLDWRYAMAYATTFFGQKTWRWLHRCMGRYA